ncbi:MAG: M23 family metallopeptidase [Gammaproteobacteria bacterium]|nr:M23 family metallopeptidase [Gammaproteobacteria bacterium]MDJ0873272.1 M23 family metallopeptidase [Gammaproteobacteria bacterium]MDJ0889943.1 M23 family metallopeptidase [Gammaproteobacteria bacterium]
MHLRIAKYWWLLGLLYAGTLAADMPAGDAHDRLPLEVPIDCQVGVDCFVQNYVDTEAGPGYRDHSCGPLSYDGHDGTDIRLRDLVAMERGVAVLAAAPGVVRGVRDGMDDISITATGRDAVRGREAGNAVAIRHGHGWETQYSHLRKGSVQVKRGQRVEVGTKLGLVGLSGATEFPHVEFSVRYRGKHLDPFTGLPPEQGCEKRGEALWTPAASAKLAYVATGELNAGFTDSPPNAKEVRSGQHRAESLPAGARAIVFWADVFGLNKNDIIDMRLTDPQGNVLAENTDVLRKHKAQRFNFIGKRRRKTPWMPGVYRGEYTLSRNVNGSRREVIRIEREVRVQEDKNSVPEY